MLRKLEKLAQRSAQLRNLHLKTASMLGFGAKALGNIGLAAGKTALKNPMGTMALASGGAAAVGKAKQYRAGFDPNVQQAVGMPTPPGSGAW